MKKSLVRRFKFKKDRLPGYENEDIYEIMESSYFPNIKKEAKKETIMLLGGEGPIEIEIGYREFVDEKERRLSINKKIGHLICKECAYEFRVDREHDELICSNGECALVYEEPAHARVYIEDVYSAGTVGKNGDFFSSKVNFLGYTASGKFKRLERDVNSRIILHYLLIENDIPENIADELKDI